MTRLYRAILAFVLSSTTLYAYNPSQINRRHLLQSVTSASVIVPSSPSLALPKSPVPLVDVGKCKVSKTIQGYWQLAGGHGSYDIPTVLKTMETHYRSGITSLDTADIYGPSESIVGKFAKDVGCGVNTKLCIFDAKKITRDGVRARVKKSRDTLGKIDVLQFFWADVSDRKFVDVALWLAELREEGVFGEVGVTNFNLPSLKLMQDAGVGVKSNQVQSSCLDRRVVQSGQAAYCASEGIKLVSFGTVGSGILSGAYLGRGKPTAGEVDTYSMRMYAGTANRFGSWELVQELLEAMESVRGEVEKSGRARGVTIGNIAQRFVLDTDPTDGCLLVGVRNDRHVADNVRTHDFKLAEGEIKAIQDVVDKRKGPKGDVWDVERGFV
ncbi:hypothetical protein TrRE_jg7865 [Triparma retinervis]|uniref:NADP-dependent oxidoreductase domain-containing protein n=1 Tax=Triparma retinervis TaxID=2557542 RepID=A0A9W7DLW9_9STRA|nr:hypothetical protein TrRE_jg7865 [Triparma retinervis]